MTEKRNEKSIGESARVDTRYYDELFIKVKDQESEEFKDVEALGNFKTKYNFYLTKL